MNSTDAGLFSVSFSVLFSLIFLKSALLWGNLEFCGQYYKNYDVVFTLSYRSKEVSVEGIHRNLLSSVRRRKYDVVNFIIQAPGRIHGCGFCTVVRVQTFLYS